MQDVGAETDLSNIVTPVQARLEALRQEREAAAAEERRRADEEAQEASRRAAAEAEAAAQRAADSARRRQVRMSRIVHFNSDSHDRQLANATMMTLLAARGTYCRPQ